MKDIEPLQLKCQNGEQDKQKRIQLCIPLQDSEVPPMLKPNWSSTRVPGANKENEVTKRFKTSQNNYEAHSQLGCEFFSTFYNTSKQLIKVHKPFLENKRIVFNVKNRNRANFPKDGTGKNMNETSMSRDNHIERLKKQIIELDKEDFVSYRSKVYSNADQIRVIENDKINKYNYQNSMIVEWKGKVYQKPVVLRPNSTIGISVSSSTPSKSFIGLTSHSSVAKKYFSKPKHRKNYSNCNTTELYGSSFVEQQPKRKVKTEQLAVGLNMFRGKMQRKKINSSFQIHC